MPSDNESFLRSELLRARARANRLIRQVAGELETKTTPVSEDLVVGLCTLHTLSTCTCLFHYFLSDMFPGGFIFYFWLAIGAPLWVQRLLEEREEVPFRYL